MNLRTPLTELTGCTYPIVQTAMGYVATPELVAASCNAGALGFLAAATLTPEQADEAIARTKQLVGGRPFGVNFLSEQPGVEEVVDAIIRHGVRVASYSRAPRADLIGRLKSAGVLCMPTVGAVRHAVRAVEFGADIIVAQGAEGGGHTGSIPTSLLLPAVIEAVNVPVVGAGGFHDGRGLAAALAMGAAGIAMGTRFLLTAESPVPLATKQRYLQAGLDDTVVTRKIDGLPHRVIRNTLVDQLDRASGPRLLAISLRNARTYARASGFQARDALKLMRSQGIVQSLMLANAPAMIQRAMVDGDPEHGALPSGQVAGVITDLPTCAELVQRIVSGAEAASPVITVQ
ncbi:MAG TPA: nitronate monooxygenase [Chloroflexota bacterium]|nr:nitronate monooxygenase [Chloroflexota bacterium]